MKDPLPTSPALRERGVAPPGGDSSVRGQPNIAETGGTRSGQPSTALDAPPRPRHISLAMSTRLVIDHRTAAAAPSGEGAPAGQPDPAQARLDPGQGAQPSGLPRDPRPDARQRPRHGLRGSRLPQHRRVLVAAPRHHDDHGRHLHPRLRVLQRRHRPARPARRRRTRPRRRCRGEARPGHVVITSVDRDDLPDGGAAPLRRHHPRHPRRGARDHDRGPDPRLPAQARRGRDRGGGPPRRLQPQPGDGAAAVSHHPARRALLRLAVAAAPGEAARSVDLHQVRPDGGPGRIPHRDHAGDGRPAHRPRWIS